MQLVGLSFQNYKAFRARESIEIRPLTVLIGKNSSGKSAVARLPLLLGGALAERPGAPLPLEVAAADFGGSFVELIHNQRPHGALDLGATFEDGGARFELRAEVQSYEDAKLSAVEELSLDVPNKGRCTFAYLDKNPMLAPSHYRVAVYQHAPVDLPVTFQGLRPDLFDVLRNPKLASLSEGLRDVVTILADMARELARTGYFGPFRPRPERYYADPGRLVPSVGRDGVYAAALLGSDASRQGGAIVRSVGEWYKEHLGGWPLDVVWSGNMFSLVLRNPDDPNVAVNLVDVGAGIAQVLPLIVQRKMEERETETGKSGGLEVVEEPELQLHPSAHGDLADLYIEAVKHAGTHFLIETHSENFLLRIRRHIAEGTLDPALVNFYSIGDEQPSGGRIQRIEVYPTGEVSAWPKGVFSEDYEEAKAIRRAQRKREGVL